MKVIILAGGKGTRLTPYTVAFPKPLLPIGDRPILEIIIKQLASYGLKDIILSVGHLGELIQAYFQNCRNLPKGVDLTYVREEKPLGTAGPISLIPEPKETFIVMNGDVLTTLDYLKLLEFHRQKEASLTVAMHKKEVKMDMGILEVNGDWEITNYIEKPTMTYFNSMGIYVYEPCVIPFIENEKYLDLPELVLRLIQNGEKVVGYYHEKPHYWLDIGRYEDYQRATEEFEKRKEEFLPEKI